MLTFVIPVRHQATVKNWDEVKRNLVETLRSVAGQTHPDWRLILIANEGADLPDLPDQATVVTVTFDPPVMPDRSLDKEAFYEAIRLDKGRRVLAGLLAHRPDGFVMVVDYDDLISRRLAETAATHPRSNGWYVEDGYLYDRPPFVITRTAFWRLCGTSLVIRADLLGLPASAAEATDAHVKRRLGSHVFSKGDLEGLGTPLERLPYPGAMYRVGHGGATVGTPSVRHHVRLRLLARNPILFFKRLASIRVLTAQLRAEFFGRAA